MTVSYRNKLSGFILLLSSVSFLLSGQADSSRIDSLKKHSLYATTGFGSNMIFLGSSISSNNPFYSAGAVYGYKNAFYLSASATHIQNTDPFVGYYSAAADYKHTFNSWFDISADLSGYKTTPSLEETLFHPFIFTNFTAGFDWKLLYTRLSGGMLFSTITTGFIQISNSRYFQTPDFFRGRSYVSFNPEINMIFGEIYTMKTSTGDTRPKFIPPFMKHRNYSPPQEITYSSKFGPMDLQFSLPVTFIYNKFSFEVEPCYLLPAYKKSNITQVPQGFTIYLSASFRFF